MSNETKTDGWTNILSKLGIKGVDRSVSNTIRRFQALPQTELAHVYAGDGLGANICEVPPADAMRNGFEFEDDDTDGEWLKACERMKVPQLCQRAHSYARAFGGALVVAEYTNDTATLDKPPSSGATVTKFKVLSRARATVTQTDIVTDATSKYFEDVELFEVSKRFGGSYKLHASRCFVLKGLPAPDVPEMEITVDDLYWGLSHLQRVYEALSNFGAFYQGIGHLGQEMVIGKYKISNLEKMLLSNDVKGIETRMDTIQLSKSTLRAVLLGKDEEYTRDALSFAGVADVFDRLMMVVSGVSRMPVTKLFGRSAAGMNASGEGDSRDYYDMVKSEQLYIKDCAEWMCAQVLRGELKPGKTPCIKFNAVWTPSQKEELEMRERQQKIDAGYIADNVYSAATCAKNRFEGGYSYDTKIEEGDEPDPEDVAAHKAATKKAVKE